MRITKHLILYAIIAAFIVGGTPFSFAFTTHSTLRIEAPSFLQKTWNGFTGLLKGAWPFVAQPTARQVQAPQIVYVDSQATGGGNGGSSNLVLYYYYNSSQIGAPPSCPANWTQVMAGYGPHYILAMGTDWLNSGTGGDGGGFGGQPSGQVPPDTREPWGYAPGSNRGNTASVLDQISSEKEVTDSSQLAFVIRHPPPPPPPPPDGLGGGADGPANDSYQNNFIAIGSDSICSQSQQSVVPAMQLWKNASSGDGFAYADACYTSSTSMIQECNLCIVCKK